MDNENGKRFNCKFSASAYEALEKLSKQRGKSMTEVLRDAISLELWVHEELKAGSRLLVEKRDGNVRELLIR